MPDLTDKSAPKTEQQNVGDGNLQQKEAGHGATHALQSERMADEQQQLNNKPQGQKAEADLMGDIGKFLADHNPFAHGDSQQQAAPRETGDTRPPNIIAGEIKHGFDVSGGVYQDKAIEAARQELEKLTPEQIRKVAEDIKKSGIPFVNDPSYEVTEVNGQITISHITANATAIGGAKVSEQLYPRPA